MTVFTVGLPDGRQLDIEATDQATALRGAQEWHQANPKPDVSVAADVAKSAGVGVAKGAIGVAGMGGDLGSLIKMGADKIGIPDSVQDAVKSAARFTPLAVLQGATSADIQRGVEKYTGEFYKPQTVAGEYAQTAGEFLPAAVGGGGVGLVRRGLQVAVPAATSETAGQVARAADAKDLEPWARLVGGVAWSAAPALLGRAVTPLPVSAERQRAAQTLRNEGVTDLTAGQTTGSKGLQYFESERGGNRGAALMEGQAEQFTRAALRRVGENANRATPEVVDRAFTRIGQQFDDLAARNTATIDQQLAQDARAAVGDYFNLVAPPNRVPAIENYYRELANHAQNGGALSGEVYQSLRSRMEATARGLGKNPEAQMAVRDLRHAVDDAMERSIQATGNVNDLAAWREARNQYRNMLVIERAATGAGENAALGLISPAALRQATVTAQGRRNYARGDGDFADLARSGTAIMTPLPNSGTAQRLSAQNLGVSPLGATVGAGIGGFFGNVPGAMIGSAVGGYTPQIFGRLAVSDVGRRYLGNQGLAQSLNNAPPWLRQALLNGVLARPVPVPVQEVHQRPAQ